MNVRFYSLIFVCLLMLGSCSNLFYYPAKEKLFYDPREAGYQPEDIFFTDAASRTLHGWWFSAKQLPAKATIIFFHGNAENLTSHFLHLAWLSKEEYNLFIFDYPGFGRSEGRPSPKSCLESGHAAVDWVTKNQDEGTPIIIYGQSLGGIIALRTVIDKKSDANIKLVVVDSAFDSYKNIAKVKLSQHWLTWPFQPLSFVLLNDRWAPEQLNSISPVPVLVIHGQKDQTVEPVFGEIIFDKLAEPKTFWRIPQGSHTDVFWSHSLKYRSKFLAYIIENLD